VQGGLRERGGTRLDLLHRDVEGILELERAAAVLRREVALVDGIGHAGEEEAILERGWERAVRAAKAGLEA